MIALSRRVRWCHGLGSRLFAATTPTAAPLAWQALLRDPAQVEAAQLETLPGMEWAAVERHDGAAPVPFRLDSADPPLVAVPLAGADRRGSAPLAPRAEFHDPRDHSRPNPVRSTGGNPPDFRPIGHVAGIGLAAADARAPRATAQRPVHHEPHEPRTQAFAQRSGATVPLPSPGAGREPGGNGPAGTRANPRFASARSAQPWAVEPAATAERAPRMQPDAPTARGTAGPMAPGAAPPPSSTTAATPATAAVAPQVTPEVASGATRLVHGASGLTRLLSVVPRSPDHRLPDFAGEAQTSRTPPERTLEAPRAMETAIAGNLAGKQPEQPVAPFLGDPADLDAVLDALVERLRIDYLRLYGSAG